MFRVWETGFTAEGAGGAEDETVTGITLTPALSRERERGSSALTSALATSAGQALSHDGRRGLLFSIRVLPHV